MPCIPATNLIFVSRVVCFRCTYVIPYAGVLHHHRGRRILSKATRRAARALYSRVQEDDPLRRPLPTARIRPLHPPRSVPAVSDMVREALRQDTRDGREGDKHRGEEFSKGCEGGGREVLIANIAESGCTMKVGIPDGQFGVHKTKKGRMLEHECAWTKCFLNYQELRKTCLNDDYGYRSPKS